MMKHTWNLIQTGFVATGGLVGWYLGGVSIALYLACLFLWWLTTSQESCEPSTRRRYLAVSVRRDHKENFDFLVGWCQLYVGCAVGDRKCAA